MSYMTLMVHMSLGQSNAAVLRVAADLAAQFDATVIGVAAAQPMPMVYGDGYVSGTFVEQDRLALDQAMLKAEAKFRGALQAHAGRLQWRHTVMFTPLADYIAQQARCADLLITGLATGDVFDVSRVVDTGDLVMQVGRPVLMVPATAGGLNLDRVVVGWKDTRESRRAVADALPLLRRARQVTVVEIATEANLPSARAHLDDVTDWLKRHGVVAETVATLASGDDANKLYAMAQDLGADVMVAGAYGHSRLREWALGGVTRDLLLKTERCTLVSH